MRSETDSATLREMLHHIDLAERFGQGRSFESLRDDLMPLYAVIRCLEIISEASRRLSDELKARHNHIPWREMAAAGNFYRHKYENVLPLRVWKTLQEDLPPLRTIIEQELATSA
ncbi:MAG TPA: HepT-like ribonuclease domain-containing protein [Xanthobacteraceae bacterium]|nr:HepT-like ribonuclease domain-containing protein [Xanthobacteraceae bacterium]